MKGEITCRQFVELLIDYLDGSLPEPEHQVFREHLEICPPCVHYLDTYERSVSLSVSVGRCIEQDEVQQFPDDIVQKIMTAWRQARTEQGGASA